MASGITHILLMKHLQDLLPDSNFKMDLAEGRDFLQAGAVGPDLPYASLADGDWFFSTDSPLADKFHYKKTNELPLKAFLEIKAQKNSLTSDEQLYLFCFFIGFISHIVADGIIHPFVRDKVGDYKENQTAHRVLEMDLDVLFFHYLTKGTNANTNFNDSNLHEELTNIYKDFYPETKKVIGFFGDMIYEVYEDRYSIDDILGWVKGLYRMLDLAEGNHHPLYKNIGFIKSYLFSNLDELRENAADTLILNVPKDRKVNFLQQEKVHFFDDIVPQFYKKFIPIAEKAYAYIFEDGEQLTETDVAEIDLDNGRRLPLAFKPTYWS